MTCMAFLLSPLAARGLVTHFVTLKALSKADRAELLTATDSSRPTLPSSESHRLQFTVKRFNQTLQIIEFSFAPFQEFDQLLRASRKLTAGLLVGLRLQVEATRKTFVP